MSCKFIWFSLPIKIKKAVRTYNSQLSSEVKKIEWYNLPKKINLLYDELYVIKGAQGSLPKPSDFIWYNLPNKLQSLCNLLDFELDGNFDITADWDFFGVTDEASFIANSSLFFIDATFVNVSNFSLVGDRLRCNIETDAKSLNMYGDGVFGIKEVIAITNLPSLIFLNIGVSLLTEFNPILSLPENLTSLQLFNTSLTEFNPTLPLPNSLEQLNLANNQLTEFNPTLPLPNSLEQLILTNHQLTEFNPTLPLPNSLEQLNLANNQLTEFNPTLPLPSGLGNLGLGNNQLTEFNPTLPLPNSLEQLNLANNQLTEFNPTLPLPDGLLQILLIANQFTTQVYEDSEDWATAQPYFINGCNMSFSGNPNSPIGTNFETILATKNVTLSY
jgi:hypothetical protein